MQRVPEKGRTYQEGPNRQKTWMAKMKMLNFLLLMNSILAHVEARGAKGHMEPWYRSLWTIVKNWQGTKTDGAFSEQIENPLINTKLVQCQEHQNELFVLLWTGLIQIKVVWRHVLSCRTYLWNARNFMRTKKLDSVIIETCSPHFYFLGRRCLLISFNSNRDIVLK